MMSDIKNINANMTQIVSYHAFLIIDVNGSGINSGTKIRNISVQIELSF